MSEITPVGSNELIDELLHNPYDSGWHFMSGNPEFWQYQDSLLKPGGRLLDVGAGIGRSCLFFAMHGMDVTAVDNDPRAVAELPNLQALVSASGGTIEAVEADMMTAEFGDQQYDTVIMDKNFVHVPSKESALHVIDKGWAALKPEGHIWVRAGGKADYNYEHLRWQQGKVEEPADVLEELCGCSGELRYDPVLFFGQTDLLQYFAHLGGRIVHSQLIPQEGHMNIMYGEDHNGGMYTPQGGMITILAQKPSDV